MRRMIHDDRGVSAVLTAILSIVLFGVAAVVLDMGMLYDERRQLQNGADAAALAVGWECAQNGIGSTNCPADGAFSVLGATVTAYAKGFADGNARDGAATVLGTSEINTDSGWIQVDLESDAPLNPLLGGVLGGGPRTVRASAAVQIVPGGLAPLAFGTCELGTLLGGDPIQGIYTGNKNNPVFQGTDPAGFAESDIGLYAYDGNGDGDYTDPGEGALTLAQLVDANEDAQGDYVPSGLIQTIGFQGGQPVNPDCQPSSGQDKDGNAGSGNFGWVDTGNPEDCRVDVPSSGFTNLWIEGREGSPNPQTAAGCTESELTGEVALIVFDGITDVNTNKPGDDPEGALDSPLCPVDGNGNITCYLPGYIVLMNITGSEFPGGWSAPACEGSAKKDCISGEILDVIDLDDAADEIGGSVRLIEPLPNP